MLIYQFFRSLWTPTFYNYNFIYIQVICNTILIKEYTFALRLSDYVQENDQSCDLG